MAQLVSRINGGKAASQLLPVKLVDRQSSVKNGMGQTTLRKDGKWEYLNCTYSERMLLNMFGING